METVIKAAAAGVCAALLAALLKRSNPELSLCLMMCACAAVLFGALGAFGSALDVFERVREFAGVSGAVLKPVIKCVGIGIVARMGADTCRDAGSVSLASAVETAGAVAALYVSLPLISMLLEMLEELT